MAKKTPPRKEDQTIPFQLPDERGNDFSQEREVLTSRPDIRYVEPDLTVWSEEPTETDPESLEEARQEIVNLKKSYNAIEKLAGLAQKRVDSRVGDLVVALDPEVDALTISAIKRSFPEAKDPTKISYEMYKQCLARADVSALPNITDKDLQSATRNPLKTDFSGYGTTTGLNRPETSNETNIIDPIDLKSFQSNAIKDLFKLLQSLNIPYIEWRFRKHLLDHKHQS